MSMRTVQLVLFPAWKYPRILQAASFSPPKCTWKTREIFGGLEKLMGVITPVVLKIPSPDLKETGITCSVGMLKPKNEHCLQSYGGTDWYEEALPKPFRGWLGPLRKVSLCRGVYAWISPQENFVLLFHQIATEWCKTSPVLVKWVRLHVYSALLADSNLCSWLCSHSHLHPSQEHCRQMVLVFRL